LCLFGLLKIFYFHCYQDFCRFSLVNSRKKLDAQLHWLVPNLSKAAQLGASQLRVECTVSSVLSGWPVLWFREAGAGEQGGRRLSWSRKKSQTLAERDAHVSVPVHWSLLPLFMELILIATVSSEFTLYATAIAITIA
jgi:hypothetical protein